jgi:hypothetical protein
MPRPTSTPSKEGIALRFLGNTPQSNRPQPSYPCRFWIQLDNDAFIFNTDRGYSQGLEVHAVGCLLPHLAERFTSFLFKENASKMRSAFGIHVGQHIYTPEDVYTPRLVLDDRPFAGWLFLSVSYLLQGYTWQVDVRFTGGLTGPQTGAGQIQTGWHRALRQFDGYTPDVEGWDNQIPNEIHGQLSMNLSFDLFAIEREMGSAFVRYVDLSLHTGGDFGTAFVRYSLGGLLRVGQILKRSPSETLGSSMIPFELYGYIHAMMHFVFHNVFVSGALWTRSHGVPVQNFVPESEIGLAMRFGTFFLRFGGVFRGREGHYQNAPLRGHRFFRIQLGYESL